MVRRRSSPRSMQFHPLTPDRWRDFVTLMGPHGGMGGCWCMFWRLKRSEYSRGCRGGNRRAMNRIVRAGQIPGILAYVAGEPAGWCSVAPREDFPALGRSPILKPLDETPVWSIVCFYISRTYRGRGLSVALIRAAVDYVREKGGKVVEAYPSDPGDRQLDPVSSYMGVPAAFRKAGFREVARPSKVRRIFRYRIRARSATPPR